MSGTKATRKWHLTAREVEILGLVAQGYHNKEIADVRGISLHTVKNHMRSIMSKLGAYNRLHAVALAGLQRKPRERAVAIE